LPTKEDKERLLLDWREHNWNELDESLRVAKEIRDEKWTKNFKCPHCQRVSLISDLPSASAKDRLDAIRTIAKMFGALATLRPEAPKVKTQSDVDPSAHEIERIKDVLREPIRSG